MQHDCREPRSHTQGKGVRILTVDDEPNIRDLARRILESATYEVLEAANGQEALELSAQKTPDLILLDLKMPGKSGDLILGDLLARDPSAAIIVVTGVGDTETAVKMLTMGAFDFILKPFGTDELLHRVEKALEKRSLILQNRDYQLNLERRVAEQTSHLERRIAEMTALNRLFQSYLAQRYSTEEAHARLANGILSMAQEFRALVDEAQESKEAALASLAGTPLLDLGDQACDRPGSVQAV